MKEQSNTQYHCYSALTIRFSCMLRGVTNQSSYDFYRTTDDLPCNSIFRKYSAADSYASAGCTVETIAQVSQLADAVKLPDARFGRKFCVGALMPLSKVEI